MAPPRVLLADDHTLVAEALRKLLEPSCNIVGIVSDGLALLEAASSLKPDVIVADVVMPLLSGLEAGRRARKGTAKSRVSRNDRDGAGRSGPVQAGSRGPTSSADGGN